MNAESSVTETVVRNHLQAFLEQKGITAILKDYDENARLLSEAKVYKGSRKFIASSWISSVLYRQEPMILSHSGA